LQLRIVERMDDVGRGSTWKVQMMRKAFKAVLTVRHIGFPEDTLKFEHARRFASKDECRAALPAIRRRAQATLAPYDGRYRIVFRAVTA
jgi:hypothetical protein